MNASRADYVTDVPYERGFIHQQTPPTLRLVAAINGVTPPPEDDFDYLEIGTGHGDTVVAVAAANPRARFVAIDINPEHIAFARDLAARAGVTNVRFLESDLQALDLADLPQFDFVCAHGIFSWLSPERRAALLDLAQKSLKPGGLFYVSYNALPGWAALEPLRRLMLDVSEGVPGSTLDRARAGVQFAQRLAEAGAAYMNAHPTVKSMLALIERAGLSYVAHEYFHAFWSPMYFADVARDLAARDLTFVGQLPLALNVRDLALPPALKEIAKHAKDRLTYETMKDYALNEMFRSDLYVRSGAAPSQEAMRAYFEHTPFGTLVPAARVHRTVKLQVYSLDFTAKVYEAILAAIAETPATAVELAEAASLAGAGVSRVADCLQNLALGGEVVPMRPGTPASTASRYRISSARNQAVVDDVTGGGESPLVLSSPVTGGTVAVTLLEIVCLHLATGVEPNARSGWLRKLSHRDRPRLKIGGRPIANGDEMVRLVTRELETFLEKTAPKWRALGILEPA